MATTMANARTTNETDNHQSGLQAAAPPSRRRVLVMDLYAYSISLFLQNSMEMGLIQKKAGEELQQKLGQSADFHTYLNSTMALAEALKRTIPLRVKGKVLQKKIGHVCGDINCTTQSMISRDGMHWCMKETGGRLDAAVACLVQCSLKDESDEEIRGCERRCNTQYMSLVPVPWNGGQQFNVSVQLTGLENF